MKTKSERIQIFILTTVFILILILLLGYLIAWKPFRYKADQITDELLREDIQAVIDSRDRERLPDYLIATEGDDPAQIDQFSVLAPANIDNVMIFSGKLNVYGHGEQKDTYFLTFYTRSPLNKKYRSIDGYLFTENEMKNISQEKPIVLGGKSLFVLYRVDLLKQLPNSPVPVMSGGEYYSVNSATDRPILFIFMIIVIFSFALAFRSHRYKMDLVRTEAAAKKRRKEQIDGHKKDFEREISDRQDEDSEYTAESSHNSEVPNNLEE